MISGFAVCLSKPLNGFGRVNYLMKNKMSMAGFRISHNRFSNRGENDDDCSTTSLVSNNAQERPRNWILGSTVAGIAGFVIFLNSLHGDLIFDDVHAIIRNRFDFITFCFIQSL